MKLKDLLHKDRIYFLKSLNKNEAITEMVSHIHFEDASLDKNEVINKLFYREKIMSTGIGIETGIPHFRDKTIKHPVIAIGIQKEGIQDYETIDNTSVKIIIMILLGENQHKEHINLLAEIVAILKNNQIRKKVINAESQEQVFSIFKEKGAIK